MNSARRCLFLAAVACAVTLPVQAQQTVNLTIGSSHPTVVPWVGLMQSYLQPEVNKRLAAAGSPYKVVWREAYGGVLYKANATLTSVGEGMVDIGWVFAATEGAKLPLTQVSSYAPALTGDPRHIIEVFNRMVPGTPALKAEWEKNNVVFLAATAADTLDLYTSFPVNGIADLKGRKLGAAGAIALLASGAGVVPVNTALPTMYNDVKTGVIDGAISIASGAVGIKLDEVTPYITQADLGSFLSGAIAVNRDTWAKLPPPVREAIQSAAADYGKQLGDAMLRSREGALKAMVQRGQSQNPPVKVTSLPAADREQWIRGLPNLAQDWAKNLDRRNQPGSQVLATYMAEVRKLGVRPTRDWDR
ncbi:C4-dicarboxylate TRAP transporter substrate-binding protein [Ramlibacter sp. AW1]|uniref:C4-dicarboxylate TRAP transporter substrate-binding protein n=1 Tax=Ramlibacter aurantiacus TaxID=2801330 RepID=A0A937D3S4_9BURK|nr:C4-dicarboxylate TRAP transporter substrate-binding protein [Ramlibacter aurantiacus]MBL0423004.1 C4-dicarboxylate TRAP transporter substrate-binding protein [Ramlibacter aurantiacus]